MKIIDAAPIPAAIYYSNNIVCNFPNFNNTNSANKYKRTITNDTILGDYVPIFNMINIEEEKNTQIVNINNITESFGVEALITKKNDNTSRTIDIEQGDLLATPVDLVFNFTEHDIVVKAFNNFVKVFPRIVNKKLLQLFSGKILFISIYSLNRESILNEIYGQDNPYKTYNNLSNKEMNAIYDFIKQNGSKLIDTEKHNDFFTANNECNKISTIKVCTLLVIDSSEFKDINKNNEVVKTLYLSSKNMLVSIKPINQVENHPFDDFLFNLSRNNFDIIRDTSITYYLVDNEDKLGPRYFNFAGTIFKIIAIKDSAKEDGLYIKYGNNKIFFSLQDILDKKVKYIYSSKEEAENGANLKERYQEELIRVENEYKLEAIEKQKELERITAENKKLLNDLEANKQQIKAKIEAELLEIKKQHEKEVREIKLEEEKHKAKIDSLLTELDYARSKFKFELDNASLVRKDIYEDRRYRQEFSIETMKTIGLIATAGLSLFLLFNKYRNN